VVAALLFLLFLLFLSSLQPGADAPPEGYSFREVKSDGKSSRWQLLRRGLPVTVLSAGADVLVAGDDTLPDIFANPRVALVVASLFENRPEAWRKPAQDARKAGPDSTARQVYLNFLKKRHGYQIQALNRTYGLDASSFTELESENFEAIPPDRMLADDVAFVSDWLEERLTMVSRRRPGQLLILLLPESPVPNALLYAGGRPVDGFAIRNTEVPTDLRKPVLRISSDCGPAIEPSSIAACIRISNP